ncbi:response regulator transcription factor [Rahnella victoriana]|uniref:response regulator transcription factor n=1 Tax=Rahnella victoriana TaxID=1510570 RepID=UPI00103A4795|nr:response regulator [Rahnella victoriana]TBX30817.1 response regulator [Rahnella victoriana]
MKILLVEDSDYKRDRIQDFLKEQVPNIEIEVGASYSSGLNFLVDNSYDLAIIDMSLPNYDRVIGVPDVEFRTYGGRDLSRQIKRRKLNVKFVFLTQFDSFSDKGKNLNLASIEVEEKINHPQNFLGCIYYEHAGYNWKDNLINVMNKL